MRRLRSVRVRTRPKPPKRPSERCWASSRLARTRDNYPLETRFSSPCLRGLWSTELPSWPQPNGSPMTPEPAFSSSRTSSLTNHCRLLRRLPQSEAVWGFPDQNCKARTAKDLLRARPFERPKKMLLHVWGREVLGLDIVCLTTAYWRV